MIETRGASAHAQNFIQMSEKTDRKLNLGLIETRTTYKCKIIKYDAI